MARICASMHRRYKDMGRPFTDPVLGKAVVVIEICVFRGFRGP